MRAGTAVASDSSQIRRLYRIPPESAVLLLVRHAETGWNAEGRIQGQTDDSSISDHGIVQARALAERLRNEPIAAVYSSDLSRAMDTARIVAEPHHLEVIPCPDMREADYGDWNSYTTEEVRAMWPEEYLEHTERPENSRVPGGESTIELAARTYSRAEAIAAAHSQENVLVVGHGGSIRGIVASVLGCLDHFWDFKLSNAGLTVVEWRAKGPRLIALNDICHLRQIV